MPECAAGLPVKCDPMPAHVIQGRVADASGKPLPEARVYFTAGPEPFPEIAAVTDARGIFRLTARSAGTYELGCAADGYVQQRVKVDTAERSALEVDVVLRKSRGAGTGSEARGA